MTIYLKEEFQKYLNKQGIQHQYVSRLNSLLKYTSLNEISPEWVGIRYNFENLKQQIITNSKNTNPGAKPEGFANNCISGLKKYLEFINQHNTQNVWVMALGANASNLDRDVKDGTISIGWEELGDLRNYNTINEIEAKLIELYPKESTKRTNDRLACYEFSRRMNVGDLVFIRHSRSNIVGYGYVTGDYVFDDARELHSHTRKFNWVAQGVWELEENTFHHLKTLTEIGQYFPDTVLKYKELVGLDENSIIYPDTLPEQETYEEGSKLTILVNAYERNPHARKKCIQHHKPICQVCNFNFEKTYGNIGKDFIHVHHLIELRNIGKSYQVNPITDLAPVCPNCHAMLHKKRPAYSIAEMKELIASAK